MLPINDTTDVIDGAFVETHLPFEIASRQQPMALTPASAGDCALPGSQFHSKDDRGQAAAVLRAEDFERFSQRAAERYADVLCLAALSRCLQGNCGCMPMLLEQSHLAAAPTHWSLWLVISILLCLW